MSAGMNSTHGVIFVGVVVAAVLYGVSCMQALYYYTNQNDPWYIRLIVTVLLIFNTVHQALIAHTVYTYDIAGWGDQAQIFKIVWSLIAEIIFTGITAFIVQCFFTMRIWRMSNRNIYLTTLSVLLATSGLVTLLIYVAKSFQFTSLLEIPTINGLCIWVYAIHAASDLLIAVTLCTLLNTSRTGFHRSDVIINRLIVSTINTGLITCLCSLISLITLLFAKNTSIYVALFFCLGRLYTNTMLATLNARNNIRDVSHAAESQDTSLRRYFPQNGGNQHQSISINIDTTTLKHHDQKLDEENSAVSACRCV